MSIERDVQFRILQDRNRALEERENLRAQEMLELKRKLNELRSVAPADLMDLIDEKNDRIEKLQDRCDDLKAALSKVLEQFAHSWTDGDQQASLRTARAILEDD